MRMLTNKRLPTDKPNIITRNCHGLWQTPSEYWAKASNINSRRGLLAEKGLR